MNVLTRSFDAARTGSNRNETQLTPQNVGSNLLVKRPFSLDVNDDPRIEAQPLITLRLKYGLRMQIEARTDLHLV